MGSIIPQQTSQSVIENTEERDIVNSFDVIFTKDGGEDGGSGVIDWVYLEKRINQQRTILPNEEILGVYEIQTTNKGDLAPSDALASFQRELISFIGDVKLTTLVFNPSLLLQSDSSSSTTSTVSPEFYKVYQHNQQISKNSNQIKTKDAEKIAIETIISLPETNQIDEELQFDQFLLSHQSFLSQLSQRIDIIISQISHCKDYEILREINSLVAKLNYKHGQSQIGLNLVSLENNWKFYMEVVISLQNLSKLDDLKTSISFLPGAPVSSQDTYI